MSNLGLYQVVTTAASKVGGVKNLLSLFVLGGAAAGSLVTAPITWFARGKYDKAQIAEVGKITRGELAVSVSDFRSVTLEKGTIISVLQTEDPEVVLVEAAGMDKPIALPRDRVRLSKES